MSCLCVPYPRSGLTSQYDHPSNGIPVHPTEVHSSGWAAVVLKGSAWPGRVAECSAGAQSEQPTPGPGPMTIDMGSLFSSARRVKGVKPRGGISGSSAQLAEKGPRDSQTSQTGPTQFGDNTNKQSAASQPVCLLQVQ